MSDNKKLCAAAICGAINEIITKNSIETAAIAVDTISIETPPKPEMGDVGFPMFPFAKVLRMAPPAIAQAVAAQINQEDVSELGEFFAVGPYVNVRLPKGSTASVILKKIEDEGSEYGSFDKEGKKPFDGRRVMVEFSSPNTNKPLHLGHLRNDALGESVSRCLKAAGADVYKVNIINNRGVHICKSMLAYTKNHQGDTPESLGIKSDRFVGDCYVEFEQYRKQNEELAEKEAQNLLVEWEKENTEVRELWQKMNDWAISGITQTYERTGISFDKFYYESETYLKGKEEILQGLADGVFYKEEDGSVWIDLEEIGLDKKVLLRKDGTALYMTQDVGTAIDRHNDWDFNELIYVVGNEQNYHFKVLFYVLKKLGYSWADKLSHLSYGMVNLPEGKMKSREGTVVDADDLINNLRDGAMEEITAKGREGAVGNTAETAEKIALGALHYYLLQVSPTKDMLFNPKESLAFNGNTGPYLQYMGARISSILRKAEDSGVKLDDCKLENINADLLSHETEWELIKTLGNFPSIVQKSAENLNPSEIAMYLYEVSKQFSSFYHECPILNAGTEELVAARLVLTCAVLTVLKNAMNLILVPFLESM